MTPAFFRIAAPLRAIGVRRRRKGDSRSVRSSALLAPHVARDAERPPAAAMEAGVQRNVFVLSRVEACQLESAFNRLGPAVAEKSLSQPARSDMSDFLRKISNRLRVINVRGAVDQFFDLRFGGGNHIGITVPGIDNRNSGKAVEVVPAINIGDRSPLGFFDDDRDY